MACFSLDTRSIAFISGCKLRACWSNKCATGTRGIGEWIGCLELLKSVKTFRGQSAEVMLTWGQVCEPGLPVHCLVHRGGRGPAAMGRGQAAGCMRVSTLVKRAVYSENGRGGRKAGVLQDAESRTRERREKISDQPGPHGHPCRASGLRVTGTSASLLRQGTSGDTEVIQVPACRRGPGQEPETHCNTFFGSSSFMLSGGQLTVLHREQCLTCVAHKLVATCVSVKVLAGEWIRMRGTCALQVCTPIAR